MIISINTENAFDSKNHSGQKLSYVKIEGNFINMTKNIYKKPKPNIAAYMFDGEISNTFSLRYKCNSVGKRMAFSTYKARTVVYL